VVLATLELPLPTLRALFEEAKANGVLVVLNATPEPGAGRDLLGPADVLIVNETEAIELLGGEVAAEAWEAAANDLRALGPAGVVITLGAAGAVIAEEGRAERVPARSVEVVDTTGAGDACCGALAARLASGETLADAARIGVAAGSLAVTRAGAQPSMPSREEIEAFLASST
jgi:ribokinase